MTTENKIYSLASIASVAMMVAAVVLLSGCGTATMTQMDQKKLETKQPSAVEEFAIGLPIRILGAL